MNRLGVFAVAILVLAGACSGSGSEHTGEGNAISNEPIPTVEVQNACGGIPTLAELAKGAPEVVLAELTGLNSEVWVLEDPEEDSGLEDVYKGEEFVVKQG